VLIFGLRAVLQAVEDNILVSLAGVRIYRNHLIENVQGNVSDNSSKIGSSASASKQYRTLVSRLLNNLQRVLIAITHKPLTSFNVQYKIELPPTLATTNGYHHINGLETSQHGLVDRVVGEDTGGLDGGTATLRRVRR
jgi:hypothetical protein